MGSQHPLRQPDALEVLAEDHRRLRTLFRTFRESPADKNRVIELTCAEISAHTQIEEQTFYPAIAEEIASPNLVEEARVEHDAVKQLVSKLQSGMLDEAARDATYNVMARMVEHHITMEEELLFEQVRKSTVDLKALADKMRADRELLERHPVLTQGQHSQARSSNEPAA
jgi:iron-sulfur cluster repair protein YtfE (RIC family)